MLRALNRLDPAIARSLKNTPRTQVGRVAQRVARGVTKHFKLRVAEWFTSAALFQLGWTLLTPPPTFGTNPAWDVLAHWASEGVWGGACVAVGGTRLMALTINGTFPSFRWSPHIRCVTAFLACFVWFQILLGLWLTGLSLASVGTFRLLLLLEFWNVYRAAIETGIKERPRLANAG